MNKLLLSLSLVFLVFLSSCKQKNRQILAVEDENWHLWTDTKAEWKNDRIYLPGEFSLDTLPVNEPSGGWQMLNNTNGIKVSLPSTVEEHYWGKPDLRKYKTYEYYYADYDTTFKNGNYLGVSWWWKEIDIPSEFKNKKIDLFIRGARLRAEVFLNGKLIGYNLIGEISFNCDATNAVKPGEKNILAIRITNPGGRLDWVDVTVMEWGNVYFQRNHGFGGLDRDIYFRAHDDIYLNDMYVLNTPDIKSVNINTDILNKSDQAHSGHIVYKIYDEKTLKLTCQQPILIQPRDTLSISKKLTLPDAIYWEIENPKLYKFSIELEFDNSKISDFKEITSGFRWFEATGIGENAVLRLNGKRIRMVSAISWGFWGYNGLFPTKELAEKEVKAAKQLGLNCLQFHRNVGKTDVLNAQDELGLCRYMEAGGGITGIEQPEPFKDSTGAPKLFAHKYMEAKISGMIRDHRSHPSLMLYCVQNEMSKPGLLTNPRVDFLIKKMKKLDPSRIIYLTSGIPPENQAWTKPYSDTIYKDNGSGYSGWHDEHTVGGPGVWKDDLYANPDSFTHRSVNKKEIVIWGEMLGAAVPDNHELMVQQITKHGNSYDLIEHASILNGYNQFIDRWGFRKAFPTAGVLFNKIGNKSYDFWGRVIETVKLAEANDYLVISGWESTAIDDHSGLVDNLRNFKGDPELISKRITAARLVFKPRNLVIPVNGKVVYDLFLINETDKPVTGSAELYITTPEGVRQKIGDFNIPAFKPEQFVYLLKRDLEYTTLNSEGFYTFTFTSKNNNLTSEDKILAVNLDVPSKSKTGLIGVYSDNDSLVNNINHLGFNAELYDSLKNYNLVIVSSKVNYGYPVKTDNPAQDIKNTDDDELFKDIVVTGYPKPFHKLIYTFKNLKSKKATITLYLADIGNFMHRNGSQSINGKEVLSDYNVTKDAGGKYIAVKKVFETDIEKGKIEIIPGDYLPLAAFSIKTNDTLIAIKCGEKKYTDKTGLTWNTYKEQLYLPYSILKKVNAGMNLLVLPSGTEGVAEYGKKLADYGIYSFHGDVGLAMAPWTGSWMFIREHPIMSGLPVNCVMDSYYQASADGGNGLLIDGKNLEVFIGYSRDHSNKVGATSFVCTSGKGKIVFHALPGLIYGLDNDARMMNPVIAKKIVINSISYLIP